MTELIKKQHLNSFACILRFKFHTYLLLLFFGDLDWGGNKYEEDFYFPINFKVQISLKQFSKVILLKNTNDSLI